MRVRGRAPGARVQVSLHGWGRQGRAAWCRNYPSSSKPEPLAPPARFPVPTWRLPPAPNGPPPGPSLPCRGRPGLAGDPAGTGPELDPGKVTGGAQEPARAPRDGGGRI